MDNVDKSVDKSKISYVTDRQAYLAFYVRYQIQMDGT